MKELTEKEALLKAGSYCASSEHCRQEVWEKLQQWGLDEAAANRVLDKLEADNYIDEERYCCAFVRDKFRFSKWGKLKIKEGLYAKGIKSGVARPFLEQLDVEEYQQTLRELLNAKRKTIRAKDDYERDVKLIRFALSRGFELKDIRLCIQCPEED